MKKRDFNPFNRVRVDVPNTNKFDLSLDNKLTLDMGKLYPVLVQDTIPGDHFKITPEMLIRFAPLVFPIMHRIDATIHFFYVPNRIIWENWPKFLAGENHTPPYFQGNNDVDGELAVPVGSLFDYLGLPLSTNIKEPVDALPWMAYLRIYNEYYQDQNNDSFYTTIRDTCEALKTMDGLINKDNWPVDNLESYADINMIWNRAWEHDYFTSALPYAQKGDAVNIPMSMLVEVTEARRISDDAIPTGSDVLLDGAGNITASGYGVGGSTDPTKLIGQSTEITGTINQLRVAMQLQKFLEKNARSGTRYNELIKAHFGVNIGDDRISRPEYIGGIKNNIVISEVLQTSQTNETSPLGDYAGYASGLIGGNTISYYCPEHGYIMAILSVVPKTAYFQGIPRKFSRRTFQDYYWQEFAHIGEQSILNKELYYDTADTTEVNNAEFGYIPRYSEYKYNPSEVHGNYRTDMLDFHLARNFGSRPSLNEEFIYVNDDKRIFAVTQEDVNSLYAHIYFNIEADRKIPFFTDPGGL